MIPTKIPTNQQGEKFMYIAPHIVGTVENHGYYYNTDNEKFPTVKKAIQHGIKILEHDDFWVARMNGDVVVKLYNSNGKPRSDDETLVTDINNEFGV